MKPTLERLVLAAALLMLTPCALLADGPAPAPQAEEVQLPEPEAAPADQAGDSASISAEAAGCGGETSLLSELGLDPLDLVPETQAASCCIDECRRDRDCDFVCGGKGTGACIQVNSCCRECACTM